LGEFNYDGDSAYISVSSSLGKFNTNRFNGIDGVQGPYQLSGANNEQGIIIIAGTEKVYVDGIEMKRGEANDYTIDYANAQITFTPNKLITSASRISVDFEYTDRQYERNFFGTGVSTKFLNNKLGIKFQYLREGDNQDAPIDISLADSDKAILAKAGDNRLKASESGVSLAPVDSQGVLAGNYEKIDTVINGKQYSYYVYNPGSSKAIYNVTFSYIGEGQADYTKVSLGNFEFVGINQGDYNPVLLLPLPELKQLGNFVLNYSPYDGVYINMDLSGSLYDQNLFSSLDDNNNFGYARDLSFKIDPKQINIGDISLGKAGISYSDRFMQSKFTTLDRIDPVEFDRDYNIPDTQTPEDQTLRELNLNLFPVEKLNINSTYGYLSSGNNFVSKRSDNILSFTDNKNYNLNYTFDYVFSNDSSISSNWVRQSGDAFYTISFLKPGVDFLAENKTDLLTGNDSLLQTSLKYYEVDPFITVLGLSGFNITTKYSYRDDYSPLNGEMYEQAKSTGGDLEIEYSGVRTVNSTLNFTIRNKSYSNIFKQNDYLNTQTILVNSQTRFNFGQPVSGNLFYQVSTQKTAKLQKVFVKVAAGTGNYKYLGDLNNNGIQDEDEFEPAVYDGDYIVLTVPTTQLFPVINLKTNTTWRISYGDLFGKNSTVGGILSPLSSETTWRIEEESSETDYKKIYLLQLSNFFNTQKTINGLDYFQQDLFLFQNSQDLSVRFRYSQQKSLSQYFEGSEWEYTRERSVRITLKLIQEMSNQTDLVNSTDNVLAPALPSTNSEITDNHLTTNFSYHPQKDIQVGFQIKVGTSEDDFPVHPTIININSQTLTFTYAFTGSGRLRIELQRDELSPNITTNNLPFQLTQGDVIGKNYFLRINFDYKISNNLQATLSYDGRKQGNEKIVHTGRAEVRAYF
jgi:hypothetical protein